MPLFSPEIANLGMKQSYVKCVQASIALRITYGQLPITHLLVTIPNLPRKEQNRAERFQVPGHHDMVGVVFIDHQKAAAAWGFSATEGNTPLIASYTRFK